MTVQRSKTRTVFVAWWAFVSVQKQFAGWRQNSSSILFAIEVYRSIAVSESNNISSVAPQLPFFGIHHLYKVHVRMSKAYRQRFQTGKQVGERCYIQDFRHWDRAAHLSTSTWWLWINSDHMRLLLVSRQWLMTAGWLVGTELVVTLHTQAMPLVSSGWRCHSGLGSSVSFTKWLGSTYCISYSVLHNIMDIPLGVHS